MAAEAILSDRMRILVRAVSRARHEVVLRLRQLSEEPLVDALGKAAARGCRVCLVLTGHERPLTRRQREKLIEFQVEVVDVPTEGSAASNELRLEYCVIDQREIIYAFPDWQSALRGDDGNLLRVSQDDVSLRRLLRIAEVRGQGAIVATTAGRESSAAGLALRFQTIAGLVELRDSEALLQQATRMRDAGFAAAADDIVALVSAQEWSKLQHLADRLISTPLALKISEPLKYSEIAALRDLAEAELLALSDAEAEVARAVNAYCHREQAVVGDLVEEQLRLEAIVKKLAADRASPSEHTRDEYEDAWKAYEKFKSNREAAQMQPGPPILTADEREALRRMFRELTWQCHPDRVADEEKERATKLFIRVREAYERGDLEELQRIRSGLSSTDQVFTRGLGADAGLETLRASVLQLQTRALERIRALARVRQDAIYKMATRPGDWDIHLAAVKRRIERAIEELQVRVAELSR